jgi:membrane-associated protease RseP (regulator of RpoE activity)
MSAVPISIVPFVIFLAVCAAFAIGYEIIRFFEKRAARKAQAAEPEQCEPPVNGTAAPTQSWRARDRYWINALLLLLTLGSTTLVGARLSANFQANRPAFEIDSLVGSVLQIATTPRALLPGFWFSLPLLFILLAHESGHYFACQFYGVDASLPYFIPAPTFLGTLGAFIRIRAPIYSKRVLFDIGVAGPIAGFVALLPILAIGLAYSKVIPGIANQGDLVCGNPLLLRLLDRLIFPGVPTADIYLHPAARAAWWGLLATALNLLPIGQLDGGHILYAFVGRRHKLLSKIFIAVLVPLGFLWWYGWLVWAGLLMFFGMRHPAIYDAARIGPGRTKLGWLALTIFLLSFTLAPVTSAL